MYGKLQSTIKSFIKLMGNVFNIFTSYQDENDIFIRQIA